MENIHNRDSETFTLNLTTLASFSNRGFFIQSNSAKSNAEYQVDFDSLFQGRADQFKRCRVRASLISNSQTNASITSDINEILGTVVLNGLSSIYSQGINGILLGITFPRTTSVTGQVGSHWILNNWLQNTYGIEITIPRGKLNIGIQFLKLSGSLMTSVPDYLITLQFELFDKK